MIIFPEINLDNVKGVFIDLDDTLYDYITTHEIIIDDCANFFFKKFSNISKHDFFLEYRTQRNKVTKKHHPSGVCRSRLLAFLGLFEKYQIVGAWDLAKTFNDFYWDSFNSIIKIDSKAKFFLEKCYQKKIPVCLITDMEMGVQVNKLRSLKCQKYITYMVSSEETGYEKPSPVMFETALCKIRKVNPDISFGDCVMIGDHPIKDIEAATKLGIIGYKVERK